MSKEKILVLAVLVCVAALGFQSTASAIVFAGGYTGPVTIKIGDYDMGTTYNQQPDGTTLTGSALTSQVLAPATGAQPGENSWGIARITEIDAPGSIPVWMPSANDFLFVMFYGEKDFQLTQHGQTQYIDGTGMKVDMYETTTNTWNPSQGSAGRTGLSTYTGVTVGAPILSLSSLPDFINANGNNGGLATEFESQFNAGALSGQGLAYMKITGGSDAGQWGKNIFATPVSTAAGVPNADIFLNWQIFPNDLTNADWLVKTNDPAQGDIIPEPVSVVIWSLLGVVGLAVGWWRRRA